MAREAIVIFLMGVLIIAASSCGTPSVRTVEVCDIDFQLGIVRCSDGFKRTARSLQQIDGYHCFDDKNLLKIAERLDACTE